MLQAFMWALLALSIVGLVVLGVVWTPLRRRLRAKLAEADRVYRAVTSREAHLVATKTYNTASALNRLPFVLLVFFCAVIVLFGVSILPGSQLRFFFITPW